MADKFPSTLLVSIADKLAKLGDEPSRRDVETEIRKADLDLLDKLNQLAQQASSSGPFVPLLPNPIISGEPSLGTPHAVKDANRSTTLVVNTSTNTIGVWSSAVTMTGVPAGARAAWCYCSCFKAGDQSGLWVEAATGYTLSDITVGNNKFLYNGFNIGGVPSARLDGVLRIHLDSHLQFCWVSLKTNSTIQIGSAIDYEM